MSTGPALDAQVDPGEFKLRQGQTAGWVYRSSDGSTEWWAYIEGVYEWADAGSTGEDSWQGEIEYIGSGPWTSFNGWKADVLGRAAAQGHDITFQQHTVSSETVSN